jgi:arsenical pump membrane protein
MAYLSWPNAAWPNAAIFSIAAVSILGVILRPWRLPEATWAVLGALALIACALLPVSEAWAAVRKGTDVYLFLLGMMLLAECARHEGLFDWLAAHAVQRARGSPVRLFALVYGVGTVVTVFLSNDATAVVLTPAVYAAAKKARAAPLPYLLVCAFIANAASFVLPISNPANLVVFGTQLPALTSWLVQFTAASLASVVVTYAVLRLTQRAALTGRIAAPLVREPLAAGGRLAAGGVALTSVLLLLASARGWPLGTPTFLAGTVTALAILLRRPAVAWALVRDISWSVLPLVAGLFVLVAGIEHTGALAPLGSLLAADAATATARTAAAAGGVAAVLCNLVNNLPLGLVAGTVASGAHLPALVTGALLIGVDLGPNLSVTGSLATLLWLVALRREGQEVSAWQFLKLGLLVMPAALFAALACFIALAQH